MSTRPYNAISKVEEVNLGFYTSPECNAVKHKGHQVIFGLLIMLKDLIAIFISQMLYAFGANLMMTCYGIVFSASGFMIPQLEDPITGFGITKDQGSWLASIMVSFSNSFWPTQVSRYLHRMDVKITHIQVVGSCTGSICGGLQSERFGRRKLIMFDCIIFVIGKSYI